MECLKCSDYKHAVLYTHKQGICRAILMTDSKYTLTLSFTLTSSLTHYFQSLVNQCVHACCHVWTTKVHHY